MSRRSLEHRAINLSQGFPNFPGPEFVRQAAADAILNSEHDQNQYAPSRGLPRLREVLQQTTQKHYALTYSAEQEILITNGATEAILLSLLATCTSGDEVIVFEPYYDSYLAAIELAGATPVFARLHAPEFSPLQSKLDSLVGPKTKAIILNDPHNPTGRVLNAEERQRLSDFVIKHDLYLICDNVYEHLTFCPHPFVPMIAMEELRERTLMLSSAGKTFGLTGWKIGWALGPKALIEKMHAIHQFNTFSVATPLQWAVAHALEHSDAYLKDFKAHYRSLRDQFLEGLPELSLLNPEGTYFCLMETPKRFSSDIEFCDWLLKQVGVSAIPCSAFYQSPAPNPSYVRFCFAKEASVLKEAQIRLAKIAQ